MKGPYNVLIKQYFNNFTNSEKRIKIATANNLFENAVASILIFGASFILQYVTVQTTTIVIGCAATALTVVLLDYMRDRVGLKPDEYSKKEIL